MWPNFLHLAASNCFYQPRYSLYELQWSGVSVERLEIDYSAYRASGVQDLMLIFSLFFISIILYADILSMEIELGLP